jgi:hypothetical protein
VDDIVFAQSCASKCINMRLLRVFEAANCRSSTASISWIAEEVTMPEYKDFCCGA